MADDLASATEIAEALSAQMAMTPVTRATFVQSRPLILSPLDNDGNKASIMGGERSSSNGSRQGLIRRDSY
jgi:hypothetical protein